MKRFCMLSTPLLYILLSFSCHKDSGKPNTAASDYFPNAVGDYWEYLVRDSIDGIPPSENYTVKVSIVGTKKMVDGIDATVWQYEYPARTDTNFIRITGDTVKVFDLIYSQSPRDLEFPRQLFILPFRDGQRWDGKLLPTDTFHVYFAPPVKTGAGLFNSTLNIFHYYIAPNTEYIDNYWFQPNVGMVQMVYNHYVLSPKTYQTWKLTRYYLH